MAATFASSTKEECRPTIEFFNDLVGYIYSWNIENHDDTALGERHKPQKCIEYIESPEKWIWTKE